MVKRWKKEPVLGGGRLIGTSFQPSMSAGKVLKSIKVLTSLKIWVSST